MSVEREDTDSMGVYKSSGNVFADLNLPDADEAFAKAELAFAIRQQIKTRNFSPAQAAVVLQTDAQTLELLANGRVGGLRFEQLTQFLNALEMNVRITVEPTADRKRGKTLVASV